MIDMWIKKDNDIVAKRVSVDQLKETIAKSKAVFNDPLDSVKKAIEAATIVWEGISPREELRLDLDLWRTLYAFFEIKPCNSRTSKRVEKKCCGGAKSFIFVYHCKLKNQPTTPIGCNKCKEIV